MNKPDQEMLAEYYDGVVSMLGGAKIDQQKQALIKALGLTPVAASRVLNQIIRDDLYDTEMQSEEPFSPKALGIALERLVKDHVKMQAKEGAMTR